MAIPRKTQKIFASVTPSGSIAQFGSLKAGTPNYSDDPAVIQGLAAWTNGWAGAVVGTNSPAIQDFNAFCRVVTQQIAYILQRGIAEWDSGTEYSIGSVCTVGANTYRSIQNSNTGHSVSDGSWWTSFIPSASVTVPVGAVTMWATQTAPSGWILCQGGVFNFASYPALGALLGSIYGGNGTTTFGVPDLRGRAPVGVGTGDAPDATGWSLASKRGTEKHAMTSSENGPHTHSVPWAHGTNDGSYIMMLRGDDSQKGTIQTGTSGVGSAHNNLQPSLGINFIIKS